MNEKADKVKKVVRDKVSSETIDKLKDNIDLPGLDAIKNIELNIAEKVKPILSVTVEALKLNKDKAAASLIALPACFEYGVIGNKAYAKPDAKAIKEYFKHLREIWLS